MGSPTGPGGQACQDTLVCVTSHLGLLLLRAPDAKFHGLAPAMTMRFSRAHSSVPGPRGGAA